MWTSSCLKEPRSKFTKAISRLNFGLLDWRNWSRRLWYVRKNCWTCLCCGSVTFNMAWGAHSTVSSFTRVLNCVTRSRRFINMSSQTACNEANYARCLVTVFTPFLGLFKDSLHCIEWWIKCGWLRTIWSWHDVGHLRGCYGGDPWGSTTRFKETKGRRKYGKWVKKITNEKRDEAEWGGEGKKIKSKKSKKTKRDKIKWRIAYCVFMRKRSTGNENEERKVNKYKKIRFCVPWCLFWEGKWTICGYIQIHLDQSERRLLAGAQIFNETFLVFVSSLR
jgi:hypothetical protein